MWDRLRPARLDFGVRLRRASTGATSEHAAGLNGERVEGGLEALDGVFEFGMALLGLEEAIAKGREQGVRFGDVLLGVFCCHGVHLTAPRPRDRSASRQGRETSAGRRCRDHSKNEPSYMEASYPRYFATK